MPQWSTAVLVVIFAVSLWFTRKHNPDDALNVSLNSTYDYIIGSFSPCGVEAHIFGHTEETENTGSKCPDFQLVFFAVGQDDDYIQYSYVLNIKNEILKKMKTRAREDEFSIIVILSRAIRQAQKIVETKALQEIGATLNRVDFDGICGDEMFDSDLYWECILRHFASTIHHPVSTSRMGNVSDETAVVDPLLRVKGIQGLRVADASIMRNLPSGNTNAPCIMIGEKASDLIKGMDTVETFKKTIL